MFDGVALAADDHVISHVETQMSDGTTQISNSLTPETAQVLAKLDPTTYAGTNIRPVRETTSSLTVCRCSDSLPLSVHSNLFVANAWLV